MNRPRYHFVNLGPGRAEPCRSLAWAGDDVWFASEFRLGRIRGGALEWVHHPSWDQRLMTSVAVDDRGLLWLGMTTGLVTFDPRSGEATTHTKANGLASNLISDIAIDGEAVWVATFEGVSAYDGAAWRSYRAADGLATGLTTAILVLPDAIVVGSDRGVMSFDGVSWTHHSDAGDAPGGRILALAPGADRGLWSGGEDGLVYFSGSAWQRIPIDSPLPDNWVYDVLAVDGSVWAGAGRGVVRFDGATWQRFGAEEGLHGDTVYALAADPEGSIWAGTNAGVARFDGTSWAEVPGLTGATVRAIDVAVDGTIWIATFGQGIAAHRGGETTWYVQQHGLPSYEVYSVHVAPDGVVWVGTSIDLRRFDGKRWLPVRRDGLAYPVAEDIATDVDGQLWVGTSQGASRFDGARWTTFLASDGLAGRHVLALTPTASMMWFGTVGGLSVRGRGGCWSRWTTQDGLPDDWIYDVAILEDGAMWIATKAGLAYAKVDSVERAQRVFLPIASVGPSRAAVPGTMCAFENEREADAFCEASQ